MSTANQADKVRRWWGTLTPWQRKMLTLVCIGGILGSLAYVASANRPARQRPMENKNAYELHSPAMAEEVLTEKIQNSLAAQGRQISELQKQLEQMTKNRRGEWMPPAQALPPEQARQTGRAPQQERGVVRQEDVMGSLEKLLPQSEIVTPPTLDMFTTLPEDKRKDNGKATPSSSPATPTPASTPSNVRQGTADTQPPVSVPRSLGVLSWNAPQAALMGKSTGKSGTAESNKSGQVSQPEDGEPEPPSFYLPRPAFFEVRLLTGLDAPTGNKAKNAPSPIAFRVQDLAWLPNGVRQNVRGCMVLAEGIGELSTERVNVRGISISCIGNDGQRVLDQTLLGYVADSDGKAGLRGQVVSKAGKLLAETMKVGFLQGLSEFFQFNARSVTVTDSGAVSSIPKSDELGNSLLGGSFSGVSKALEKVSDYYMDLAEEVFPVIQVSASRNATFVVTQGTKLVFDKTLATNLEENPDEML